MTMPHLSGFGKDKKKLEEMESLLKKEMQSCKEASPCTVRPELQRFMTKGNGSMLQTQTSGLRSLNISLRRRKGRQRLEEPRHFVAAVGVLAQP